MPSSIILSEDEARNANINDPDYRLHCAALSVLSVYFNGIMSSKKVSLPQITSKYNKYNLNRPEDRKLKVRALYDYVNKLKKTIDTPEQRKYIYVQIMKTNDHSLRQNVVVEEKEREQYG